MTTSACFELLLYICMPTISWKMRLQIFSVFFSLTAMKQVPRNIKVFTWRTLQKLKTCIISIFFMLLIPLTEISMVNLLVDVIKTITKMSSFYVTTITFATSTTSKPYSKLSDAVPVTRFFQRLVFLNNNKLFIYLHWTRETYIPKERLRA